MVDRRLVGFLSIILVVATIVSILVFSPGERERIRVLASRTPERISAASPGSPSYSFELMAARDLPYLVVETHFLARAWPATLIPWSETAGRGAMDLVGNVPRLAEIKRFLEMLGGLVGLESPYSVLDFDIDDRRIVLFDFSDAVGAMAGQDRIDDQYTAYAFILDDQDTVSIYAGYRDFFFGRDTVIAEVRYQGPGVSECFGIRGVVGSTDASRRVADAPMGRIRLDDLEQNDRVRVDVGLDTSRMFGHSGLLQLVTTDTGFGFEPSVVSLIGS